MKSYQNVPKESSVSFQVCLAMSGLFYRKRSFKVFFFNLFISLYVWLFCRHVCLCMYVWCLWKSEEGVRTNRTGIRDNCGLPYGCRELNLGPLEKQHALLNIEPSLQPLNVFYLVKANLKVRNTKYSE